MRRECQRKVLSFISYSIFISITPRSLAPKFSFSLITFSPIPCSLIACSATLTPLLLFPPNHLLPYRSIDPTHPVPILLLSNLLPCCLIALPFIFKKFLALPNLYTPDQSSITLVFCCWLSVDSHRWHQIYRSHRPGPWFAAVVTGILISNLPLIFENSPSTCTPHLIDPWSILDHPDLLLFIVGLFSFLTRYISLLPTRYLVFCCSHWSSDIKYSSYFRKKSLHLYSTIDRPLINRQLPWSYAVDYWRIRIADPRSITPSHPYSHWSSAVIIGLMLSNIPLVFEKFLALADHWLILNHPGLLLLIFDWCTSLTPDLFLPPTQSLVFFCRHWSSDIKSSSYFRNFSFHLRSKIDRPLTNRQLPWSSGVYCWLICISDPRYIAPTNRVPSLLLSSLVLCYQIFLLFSKKNLSLALHNW